MSYRVQIVDRNHPHFPEHGVMTGEMTVVLGTPMAKVKLDNCRHGTDACYVRKGQVALERSIALPEPTATEEPR